MGAFISVREITKDFLIQEKRNYRKYRAIENVSFNVERGEFVAIVGRSGSGKSTVLNLIAGLLTADHGAILYDQQPVARVNTKVGYMTQRDNLIPWRTIAGNLALPLLIRRLPSEQRTPLIARALEQVGLAEFHRHYPSQVSGGMRQRAALARMMIYDPETLLMDEPFGALDEQLKLTLQGDLEKLWEERQKTVVYVTHDLGEAIALADRVLVFAGQPGTICAEFKVPFGRPRDIYMLRYDSAFIALHRQLWEAIGGPTAATTRS